MSLIGPPRWNEDELDEQIARALEAFREERVTEPVEQYRHVFDVFAARVRTLLAVTDNLSTTTSTQAVGWTSRRRGGGRPLPG